MLVYGIMILVVGVSLFGSTTLLVNWLHHRYKVPYALVTVGVITYIGALLVQVLLLRVVDRALLSILPVGALAIGLAAGFSEEIARFLGFQYLARSTVTRPQALMIGAGHGLTEAVYTGLVAVGIGLSLIAESTDLADDIGALASGALAEMLNGMLPVVMHMALSWIVLQVFLRGELYWLFWAIFAHTVVEITATLLGPNDSWAVVIWRVLVALMSLALIVRIRAPTEQQPSGR